MSTTTSTTSSVVPNHHPDDFKHTLSDKFLPNNDLEDIFRSFVDVPAASNGDFNENDDPDAAAESLATATEEEIQTQNIYVLAILEEDPLPQTEDQLNKVMIKLRRKYKRTTRKSTLLRALARLLAEGTITAKQAAMLRPILVKKPQKSQSGVLVVTVLTSPYPKTADGKEQEFTCAFDCFYCPKEPAQPRSYLHDEPSVLRANRNHFDAVLQFFDRVATLTACGHPADKIELLILGGTWDSYPLQYREEFVRDLFYAANSFAPTLEEAVVNIRRERKTLQEEKLINETTSGCKIIGITCETRPDCITTESVRFLRKVGCTRVQLGLQHTNDAILKKVNRGHDVAACKQALEMLKDCCYKVDLHLMPNLPGATPRLDFDMFLQMTGDPDLQADQWKIYPTEITPWTTIEKWFRAGTYVPYGEHELLDVLARGKSLVKPWIRLNRVIRDIPSQYILGGVNSPSMRNDIQTEMTRRGLRCLCLRCREVGAMKKEKLYDPRIVVRRYLSNGGMDFFISYEACDQTTSRKDVLLGFCRLRLPPSDKLTNTALSTFPELDRAALIRELHVYGQLAATPDASVQGATNVSKTQHVGIGTMMMQHAEDIVVACNEDEILAGRPVRFTSLAVIAGVGSRGFYRKIGYELVAGEGEFMCKGVRGCGANKSGAVLPPSSGGFVSTPPKNLTPSSVIFGVALASSFLVALYLMVK